jgi:hypothetical protein
MIANIKEELLQRSKSVLSDNSIVEVVIWRVPEPVPGSRHAYKYRLFFGRDGQRMVGFDNERGKGDHMHRDDVEEPYDFISVEKLMADFMAEIKKRRQRK